MVSSACSEFPAALPPVLGGRSLLKCRTAPAIAAAAAAADRNDITLDDQQLELVPGQRGKLLLLIDGYTLPRNNIVGSTTYWCCRWRAKGSRPCNARVTTTQKPSGLHKVVITRGEHTHPSTWRPRRGRSAV